MTSTLHGLERRDGSSHADEDYWAQARSRILGSWIRQSDIHSILDVGCGSGYLTRHVATFGNPVVGVDADAELLHLTEVHGSPAEFCRGDALRLPFRDGTFDGIIVGDVLEHFERQAVLLAELRRVLTNDGRIFVSLPAYRFLWGPHDEQNDHVDRFTASRLADMASGVGLTVTRHRYTNFLPLIPYFVLQRILKCDVPESARGGHGRILESVKDILLNIETAIPWPVGVTLLAELSIE